MTDRWKEKWLDKSEGRLELLIALQSAGIDQSVISSMHLGAYKSPWNFLVSAARSNLMSACIKTIEIINEFARGAEEREPPLKIMGSALAKIQLLDGHLMGSILCSVAAIETFLRAAVRIYYERGSDEKDRIKGMTPGVKNRLAIFDELKFRPKLNHVYREISDLNSPPKRIKKEFHHLITFRNHCFHQGAIVFMGWSIVGEGQIIEEDIKISRDETGEEVVDVVDVGMKGEEPEYPLLWRTESGGIGLKYAIRAAELHDSIVKDIVSSSNGKYIMENLEPGLSPEITDLLRERPTLQDVKSLASDWEEFSESELSHEKILEVRESVT